MNHLVRQIMAGGGSIPATVTITSDESEFTDATPFEIQIVFSKAVTGFVVGDITISNASLSNFSGSGTSYTADVTPDLSDDISISVAENVTNEGNTASNVVTVTDNVPAPTEQGFDLTIGTPGTHVFVGGDDAHIENPAQYGTIATAVLHKATHAHSDTTLRYFEATMYHTNATNQGFIGYGLDCLNNWVGNAANAAGYLVGVKQVRLNGSTTASGGKSVQNGEIAFVYTRGQRVWFGSYTAAHGVHIMGGGDPATDTSPSAILTATGSLRPICTCHYGSSEIKINTIGNWSNPSVIGSAVPWDS